MQEQWPLPRSLFATRRNNYFKLCNSVVAICFNDLTKMVEVPAVANPIPLRCLGSEMLSRYFIIFTEFVLISLICSRLIPENPSFSDIIGVVCDIRAKYNDHTQTTQRVFQEAPTRNFIFHLH